MEVETAKPAVVTLRRAFFCKGIKMHSLVSLKHDIEKSVERFFDETNARNQTRVNRALDAYRKAVENNRAEKQGKPPKWEGGLRKVYKRS